VLTWLLRRKDNRWFFLTTNFDDPACGEGKGREIVRRRRGPRACCARGVPAAPVLVWQWAAEDAHRGIAYPWGDEVSFRTVVDLEQ
jgi:hypothetical protein